jgi:cystathionine gamma-synthase
MRFATLAVHAAHDVDPQTGAIAPPLHLSTTYARDAELRLVGEHQYIREGNPTQSQLERALAPLEGGEAALVLSSGMAAAAAVLQSLEPGAHVVLPDDAYYHMRAIAHDFLPRWGMRASIVDMADLAALRAALTPQTRLVWLESPSNPLLKVVDLAGAIDAARVAGALTAVDNTFATPALQRPLELGADVVLHSTTKYFGGHSDVQGGALVFRRRGDLAERVEQVRQVLGGVSSPFNSWLVLRGIRTLACRVEAQSRGALAVARALEGHPQIAAVHYPGLESHPNHEVARRQMSAFGAMMSLRIKDGETAAKRAVGRMRLFTRATSLGGVESLVEHRRTSEGPHGTAPPELIRLSIGLEHPDDLIADLQQALEA